MWKQAMVSQTARKPMAPSETRPAARAAGKLIAKKIWLPKLLYDALPYFYLAAGSAAFFATLYISEWFWVLPHYLLFSAACIHLGIAIRRRRSRPAADSLSELS
jgi:hypothetical protein